MLLNDKKVPIDRRGIFTKDGELTNEGEALLIEKVKAMYPIYEVKILSHFL